MGKKNKNKQKISGSVKTAMKTEKKLSAKQKKELAAIGEVSHNNSNFINALFILSITYINNLYSITG